MDPSPGTNTPCTAHWDPAATGEERTRQNDALDDLAEQLIDQMNAAWERGQRPLAEEFLTRHPQLRQEPQVAIRVVLAELFLRQQLGQTINNREILERFPDWHNELIAILSSRRFTSPDEVIGYPLPGESLGSYRILAELGRGGKGIVYLAEQTTLANRPVVLKMSPGEGEEHLALARMLLHTNIVPLYDSPFFPDRGLRVICMPYLGGASLDRVLKLLREKPPAERTTHDLLAALDEAAPDTDVRVPVRGPIRSFLARQSYVQAICWIGACLADALQYAHERGLIHLDIKPGNVLLTAEGQPMLLDFHLAREPLRGGSSPPRSFGGTPDYMSPEQRCVLEAASRRGKTPTDVDGRSDVYSLGMLLYEALGGPAGLKLKADRARVEHFNDEVSPGLSDIVQKCLARDPRDRYATAGLLAADLRRHFTHQPLKGVCNRSWKESWLKWRARRPHDLTRYALASAAVILIAVVTGLLGAFCESRVRDVRNALEQAETDFRQADYSQAEQMIEHGLEQTRGPAGLVVPGTQRLAQQLHALGRKNLRARNAESLHREADALRMISTQEMIPSRSIRELNATCRQFWDAREYLLDDRDGPLPPELEDRIRRDLLELAVLWTGLCVHSADRETMTLALNVLDSAEALFGGSPALHREKSRLAGALGQSELAAVAARKAREMQPRNAWEFYALARSHLQAGELDSAARKFEESLHLDPQEFWANFHDGICAYRQERWEHAVAAFRTAIACDKDRAECYYNRGQASAALGQHENALRDYREALGRKPDYGDAHLGRGVVFYSMGRHAEALDDLQRALRVGGDPVACHYNLALVHLARGDRKAAAEAVRQVLRLNPQHAGATELKGKLG